MAQAKSSNHKCVKKGSEVYRLPNNQIKDALSQGFTYCPRSEWKQTRETNGKKRQFKES